MPCLKGQSMLTSGHLPWECGPTLLNIGNRSAIFKAPLGATFDPQKARCDFSRSVCRTSSTHSSVSPARRQPPQYCCVPHTCCCFTLFTASIALSPFLPKSLANLGSHESLMQGHSQALRLALSPVLPTPQAAAGQDRRQGGRGLGRWPRQACWSKEGTPRRQLGQRYP